MAGTAANRPQQGGNVRISSSAVVIYLHIPLREKRACFDSSAQSWQSFLYFSDRVSLYSPG